MKRRMIRMNQKSVQKIAAALLILVVLPSFINAQGQPPDIIANVSPTSAKQGESFILTVNLQASGSIQLPPSEIVPASVKIANLAGTNISRTNLSVTANFIIPANESIGSKDVSIEFPAPADKPDLPALVSTKVGAFEILSGSEAASLQVNIEPADAVSAGAQWKTESGSWQNSGDTITGLSVGTHTISFMTIEGWTVPESQTVNITEGQRTTVTGTYIQNTCTKGDIDGNGTISINDAITTLKFLAGLNPDDVQLCSDVNNDDQIGPQEAIFILQSLTSQPDVDVFYVDVDNVSGVEDGQSWSTAYKNLQDAMDAAYESGGGTVWVAEGIYLPTEIPTDILKAYDASENNDNSCGESTHTFTDAQYKTFVLREGVVVYGGFSGTETSLEQRNLLKHKTILSGDLNGDDCSSTCNVEPIYTSCNATQIGYVEAGTNYDDNVYHVVMSAKVSNTVLDGFTIRGGNANGNPSAGTACGLFGTTSDEEIYRILKGYLSSNGGGIIVLQSAPLVRNAIIEYNRAIKGGGAYHLLPTSPQPGNETLVPEYDNVIFQYNYCNSRGGAICNDWNSSPVFQNSQFLYNVSDIKGGAVYSDMGCDPKFVNVLFVGNRSERGGGAVSDGSSNTFYAFTTFVHNEACDIGAALYQGTHRADSMSGNSPYAYASIVLNNDSLTNGLAITNWLWSALTEMEGSVIQESETETNPEWSTCLGNDYEPAGSCVNIGWSSQRTNYLNDTKISKWVEQMEPVVSGDYYDVSSSSSSQFLYVDSTSTCSDCNGSKNSPYTSLRSALSKAGNGTTIYIAPGFYAAAGDGLNREDAAYVVPDGTAIIGCNAAFSSCADQENFLGTIDESNDLINANLPVLSGGSSQSDTVKTDNAYHVVILGSGSSLKGVVIQDGYADANSGYHKQGGGVLTYESKVTIENVLFQNNYALEGGAFFMLYMPAEDTSSRVSNSAFYKNIAEHSGGAILGRVGQNDFSITFTNVIFEENEAKLDRGGAVYVDYGFDADFIDCSFINNASTVSSGGAVYVDDNASQFPGTVVNFYATKFSGNTAAINGGAFRIYMSMTAVYVDRSCTFTNNTAGGIASDAFVGYSGQLCYDASATNMRVNQVDTATVYDNSTDGNECDLSSNSGNGNGPPQEAIDACNNLNIGESCFFDTPNGTVSGTCQDMNNTTSCVPEGGPPNK
jgi:predicted outer membrane repeat protein